MKRLLFCICLVLSVQIMSAQIITSSQVGKVEKVKKPKKVFEKVPLEKGYRGFVEAALSICDLTVTNSCGFDILTTHGWQVNKWLYIGGGVGLIGMGHRNSYYEIRYYTQYSSYDSEDTDGGYTDPVFTFSIPAYADIRLYVLNTKVKPFVDAKIGGLIQLGPSWSEQAKIINETENNQENWILDPGETIPPKATYHRRKDIRQGGLFFQVGVGVEYKWFDFGFNYSLRGEHITKYSGELNIKGDSYYSMDMGFTFNIAYNF